MGEKMRSMDKNNQSGYTYLLKPKNINAIKKKTKANKKANQFFLSLHADICFGLRYIGQLQHSI